MMHGTMNVKFIPRKLGAMKEAMLTVYFRALSRFSYLMC